MTENNPRRNEEIDLFYFLRPAANLGRKFGRSFINYLAILNRTKFIALAILIAVTAVGFSLRYILPKAFKTEGLFVSHVLPSSYCVMMIERLNELNKTGGNENIIAQQLQINENAVRDIRTVSLIPMSEAVFSNKADTINSLFKIELVLGQMTNLDSIQKGILNYLENSEYSKKRMEAKVISLRALQQDLRQRVRSLDTLKRIVNNSVVPRAEGQGIILGEPLNPVLVYEAENKFYNSELKVSEDLALIDNVEIIQPFSRRNDYNYPRFNLIVVPFFIAGLILALIAAPFFDSMRRKAKNV